MKRKFLVLLTVFSLILGGNLFAQTVNARQLDEAINSGNVTFVSANGAGNINSVTGRLRNNTANEIMINVVINNGMYLANSGRGQNMLAQAVYQEGFQYYSSGTTRYIRLPANNTTNIVFSALCANRALDTPALNHSFSLASMPANLRTMSTSLSTYYAANFGRNIFSVIQLALWRNQGENVLDIINTINFTFDDWQASSALLGITDPPPVNIVSGTYSYSSMYTLTITGSSFTMNWGGTNYTGTYFVIGNNLALQATNGTLFGFLVNSPTELMDADRDIWRR